MVPWLLVLVLGFGLVDASFVEYSHLAYREGNFENCVVCHRAPPSWSGRNFSLSSFSHYSPLKVRNFLVSYLQHLQQSQRHLGNTSYITLGQDKESNLSLSLSCQELSNNPKEYRTFETESLVCCLSAVILLTVKKHNQVVSILPRLLLELTVAKRVVLVDSFNFARASLQRKRSRLKNRSLLLSSFRKVVR